MFKVRCNSLMAAFNVGRFISEIKKYPFLFDENDNKFSDVNLKEYGWSLIAKEFGVTEDYAKKRWKTLVYTYRKHKKEYFDSLQTGDIKIPKWMWFSLLDEMPTLHEFTHKVNHISTIAMDSPSTSTSNISENITITRETSLSSTSTTQKRKKLTVDAQSTAAKVMAGANKTKPTQKQDQQQDEAYFYCMSLLPRLRNLTPKEFALARLKIESVLFDVKAN